MSSVFDLVFFCRTLNKKKRWKKKTKFNKMVTSFFEIRSDLKF